MMTQPISENTAGPWFACEQPDESVIVYDENPTICANHTTFGSPKVCRIEAGPHALPRGHLIAAAPELLEALQAFMSNRSVVAGLPMTAAKARAAITKATGAA